jgi:cell division protease FtsH
MFLGREVGRQQDYSELTAQKIDAEVGRLISEAHAKAKEILEANRDKVELLVTTLLDKETIDGDDATDIIKFGRVRTHEERFPDGEPVDDELAKIDAEMAAEEAKEKTASEPPGETAEKTDGETAGGEATDAADDAAGDAAK